MNIYGRTIRMTVACDFCGTTNDLTINDVSNHHAVHCSSCSALLGQVGDLRPAVAAHELAHKQLERPDA